MKTAQRLMVQGPLDAGVDITLDPGQTHYLIHVLRLGQGAPVLVFDGVSGEWQAVIASVSKKSVTLTCEVQTRPQDQVPALTLAFAPIKGDRLEAIIEKATELGAAAIVPVLTERTIVRKLRLDRLEARAVEAAEQTGRLSVPQISDLVPLSTYLTPMAEGAVVLFADEAGEAKSMGATLNSAITSVTVLIGPEGGFTPAERAVLRACAHVHPISLGPRILRADTACFASLSLVQTIWGDWT